MIKWLKKLFEISKGIFRMNKSQPVETLRKEQVEILEQPQIFDKEPIEISEKEIITIVDEENVTIKEEIVKEPIEIKTLPARNNNSLEVWLL